MSACAISNRFDKERFAEREKYYLDRIGRYDAKEQRLFPELFASVVDALDADHEQDFLGNLFMQLELSNHWKGQFLHRIFCAGSWQICNLEKLTAR